LIDVNRRYHNFALFIRHSGRWREEPILLIDLTNSSPHTKQTLAGKQKYAAKIAISIDIRIS